MILLVLLVLTTRTRIEKNMTNCRHSNMCSTGNLQSLRSRTRTLQETVAYKVLPEVMGLVTYCQSTVPSIY